MSELLRPDLCIIGGGSAGLTVAAAAVQFGASVVLIERGRMGGDCLNYGCVPSKALLAAAKHAQAMRGAGMFGIEPVEPKIDFAALHDRVHGVIAAIAPNDSVERFTALGVRVIEGDARFLDKRTVIVGDVQVKARRFIVATGSSPAIPDIPGLSETPYLTNETIFELSEPVRHLIVLGAGPVGLELAQAYRRLGAHVTVIDRSRPLARMDEEAARIVQRRLEDERIVIHKDATATRVEPTAGGVRVHFEKRGETKNEAMDIEGSHLLVATGRKPNIEGLDLDKAKIRTTDQGIRVNKRMKTRNGRVYAIGDVIGPPQFTHLASHQAEIVLRNAVFRLHPSLDLTRIPRTLYTDPELAEIGLTEEEARKHTGMRILRWPYADNDRAQAEGETAGFIKLFVDRHGGILGCVIVGANAGDLIGFWALAIAKNAKIGDIAGLVFPYPTVSELAKRAAITYYQPLLRKPYLRRIAAWLRKLG